MRANVNIARKQRHTRTLENFKGVDLSSSPLRVSTQRATYMRNMWSENGANHKRPGWRDLLEGAVAWNGKIKGIFPFEEVDGDGNSDEILLVHTSDGLYRLTLEEGRFSGSKLLKGYDNEGFSQCFYRDGRAYIIGCGQYLTYGLFDGAYGLKELSEIAYVPTTTIRIGPNGAAGNNLDAINLATSRRKNTLIGKENLSGEWAPGGTMYWRLDGNIKEYTRIRVNINMVVWTSEVDCERFELKYDGKFGYQSISDYWIMVPSEKERLHIALKNAVSNDLSYSEDLFGFQITNQEGGACLFVNLPVITEGSDNYIEFEANGVNTEKITRCTAGVMFGTDGASDRLFLAGNPLEKGVDRWSKMDDFTYFPDGNAMFVGSGDSAITGYTRLSDGTLGIFKEEKPGMPTIYYRTGAKTVMTDADGEQVPQEYFPVKAGMAGDGLVSPRAMANLAGDPLILTPSGVYGVELSENVASGERYTRERSRAIREELCKKDLSAAVGFVYRGRYYLSTGDGTCYVADARYKTTFEGSPDTGYEWWVWDNVPATAFAEYDGKLVFGTADGRICVFEDGMFADHTYITAGDGDLLADADTDYVTYGNIQPKEGDTLFVGSKRYRITNLDAENQRFSLVDEDGKALDITDGFLTGVIEHISPVVAEWASPVMDLGTSMARKTLLSLGVVLEPGVDGPVQISLETRDGVQQLRARNEHDFDFGALDFGDLSFTGSFAASTTRRMNLRNFNFIQVKMRSEEPRDMAVSGVTLEYKINQTNRGYY